MGIHPNDWRQLLISILGTAIGVGLTFIVNGIHENRKKDQARRLTAIMVIHDIDDTIELLKQAKEQEEEHIQYIKAVQKRQDQFDEVSFDSLYTTINYLVNSDPDYHFDTSKEKIFNSDLDTWQNLGSMKFIDNVQSFFYGRQDLEKLFKQPDFFSEPIPMEEFQQIFLDRGWGTQEEYAQLLRPFLKAKFSDKHVLYYINASNDRIRYLASYIDSWTSLNEENKFLMGLTDQELDDYLNSILNNGKALTPASLVGRWEQTMENDNITAYTFHHDHTFDYMRQVSQLTHQPFWSGCLKYTVSQSGTWAIEADSLVVTIDLSTFDLQMDISGLEAMEDKQDSLESWARQYRQSSLDANAKRSEQTFRKPFKARLDSSNDKMEWTDDNGKRYMKRKD